MASPNGSTAATDWYSFSALWHETQPDKRPASRACRSTRSSAPTGYNGRHLPVLRASWTVPCSPQWRNVSLNFDIPSLILVFTVPNGWFRRAAISMCVSPSIVGQLDRLLLGRPAECPGRLRQVGATPDRLVLRTVLDGGLPLGGLSSHRGIQ